MKKILRIYNELPIKMKILILILFCLILGILTRILSNYTTNDLQTYTSELDYKNINIEKLINENYHETYEDRDAYIILKNIIEEISKKYNTEKNIYKDYYSTLDSKYSKFISKKRLSEKLFTIISKLKDNNNNVINFKMYTENNHNNVYILELINYNNEVSGYIGIIIDYANLKYYIFYVE